MGISIVPALVALSFLIVVHEGGHYFVARWCKMRVDRFSIGFGPGILKHKSKSGTVFQLAPIPFGGFVEIRGMNIADDIDAEDPSAYPNRPAWQRFLTIFAGPATNYLSAVLIAFCLYNCHGVESATGYVQVDSVREDYDAHGKLQPGDRIMQVDHEPLYANKGVGLTERVVAKKGAPILLTVLRSGATVEVSITPKPYTDEDGKQTLLLGITRIGVFDTEDVGVIGAAGRAIKYPVVATGAILGGIRDIFTGAQKADPGGPKRIVEEFSKAFKSSFVDGIRLVMLLSVYLGLFNLLPLPALDGGRLVFLGYELVTRRRANPKIEAMVHMGGVMVLALVMIAVTLHDFHVF